MRWRWPEQAHLDKVGRPADPVDVLADPVEGLQVAQAALALLHVRFEDIALAALTLVVFRPLGELRLDELRARALEEFRTQLPPQVLGERPMAGQEAAFQERGADRVVLAPEPEAVLHRAARMAHLQLKVPEHVEHRFDHALGPGGGLPRREEEQIHVRMRRHFRPAVAADGKHRDAFALGGVRERVKDPGRQAEDHLDRRIHHCGEGADSQRGTARVGREIACDRRQDRPARGRQCLDNAGALRARIPDPLEGGGQVRAESV